MRGLAASCSDKRGRHQTVVANTRVVHNGWRRAGRPGAALGKAKVLVTAQTRARARAQALDRWAKPELPRHSLSEPGGRGNDSD